MRLFTTLVRFDAVYYTHFKTNLRRIVDYPNIWGFTRDIYQLAGVAETTDMAHIKSHYFESHTHINPFGIVPDGPALDFEAPHGRGLMNVSNDNVWPDLPYTEWVDSCTQHCNSGRR